MELAEYEKMYCFEKDYWWFVVKRKIVRDNLPPPSKGVKLLDVGCGTGIVAKELVDAGYDVYALDIMPAALDFCRKRGLKKLKLGSLMRLPFQARSFDAVICLDVLYHKQIKDDRKAMREIFRVLKPRGVLLVTDSACPALFSRHDLATHARERYTKKELCLRLKSCGFSIRRASYFNTILFPMIFIMRKVGDVLNRNAQAASSDLSELPRPINALLRLVFTLESNILKRINLPFGVSVLCVAVKPEQ